MNYEEMSLDELKEVAKEKGLKFGKIGKEKLIEKIIENDNILSAIDDEDDMTEVVEKEEAVVKEVEKPASTEDLLSQINGAIDDLEDSEEEELRVDVKSIDMNKEIPCKSITYGGLTYVSKKTGAKYRWGQIGATEYLPMIDLVAMNNDNKNFLTDPLVILQDVDAIKYFRLNKVYENVAKVNNLKSVFNSGDMDAIKNTIRVGLDANMREVLLSKITQMIKNNVLTNVNIIRLCEKELEYDFSAIIE